MNHDILMQQQQQQQQKTSYQSHQTTNFLPSNSGNSLSMTLNRSDSVATVILDQTETESNPYRRLTTLPPSIQALLNRSRRSFQKTSGQFNDDFASSDKLSENLSEDDLLFIQKLLSEIDRNDNKLGLNNSYRLEGALSLDSRTLSELFRSDSFEQILASLAAQNNESQNNSFSELRSVSPEYSSQNYPEALTNESEQSMVDEAERSMETLTAVQHDHAFLCKRAPPSESSSSSSSIGSKSAKNKRSRNVNRAKDIETPDDLSYYLERRRKNNEASKVSRAARKQKFHQMDKKCDEYERVNQQLRDKISVLEKVTTNLKSGLIHNFQRK